MAPPDSPRGIGSGASQKPDFSVYTMLLIIAFIAMTTACVLLWMELSSYGSWPQWNAR